LFLNEESTDLVVIGNDSRPSVPALVVKESLKRIEDVLNEVVEVMMVVTLALTQVQQDYDFEAVIAAEFYPR
jgi:hypothetical protein